MKKGYTQKEVSDLIGIHKQTIAEYANDSLVVPDHATATGKGSVRRYSRDNLAEFLLVQELSKNGIPRTKIKALVNEFLLSALSRKKKISSTEI